MNIVRQIVIGVFSLFLLSLFGELQKKEIYTDNSIELDTLKIGYLDTLLIGKQLFPTSKELREPKELLNDDLLLFFESNSYYFAFYNREKKNDFLIAHYWDQLISEYIDFSVEDGLLSYSRFTKVNYNDPFLIGFYNSKDSIITAKFDVGASNFQDQFHVHYLSTSDTLLKINKTISVRKKLDNILSDLKIPNTFIKKSDFELVLMEATTQIDNAWYNDFPDHCSDYSVAIILSIKNNKISRIEYLDLEYIDYVFKQKSISTKDIHYQ